MPKVRRDYKNSLFLMLCQDRQRLLRIYNAVNKTHYTNADELEITTLENAIYLNMKNDVSFILDFQLNLYEHQSTVNPNMPLRDLFYVAMVLQVLVRNADLYGSALVKIPTPKFIVFYNGAAKQPRRREYRLSDSFIQPTDEPQLELIVTVININPGENEQLMQDCKDLRDYSIYIEKVRHYTALLPVEEAVERAVTECIQEGILAEFLSANRAEVIAVSIFEYNEELYYAGLRQEGYETGRLDGVAEGIATGRAEGIATGRAEGIATGRAEGIATGRAEGIATGRAEGIATSIIELLTETEPVPADLQSRILTESDLSVLKKWLKYAAKAQSISEFQECLK